MESLIKQQQQKRGRISGGRESNREVLNNVTDTRISPRQTESFKRDKRAANWYQGQFSSQMSQDFDYEDTDRATAIAAATFAVYSADESRMRQNQKSNGQGINHMMTGANNRKEDNLRLAEQGRVARRLSNDNTRGRPEATRKPMGQESSIRPATPATRNENRVRNSAGGRFAETKAEAWERAETAKIQKWYEKMNSKVLAWENEKKKKAKHEMERKKAEMEHRKARNSQNYQFKLAKIDNIAEGARKQLEEKRKNGHLKVEERAKRIRSSGKVPGSCLCF